MQAQKKLKVLICCTNPSTKYQFDQLKYLFSSDSIELASTDSDSFNEGKLVSKFDIALRGLPSMRLGCARRESTSLEIVCALPQKQAAVSFAAKRSRAHFLHTKKAPRRSCRGAIAAAPRSIDDGWILLAVPDHQQRMHIDGPGAEGSARKRRRG